MHAMEGVARRRRSLAATPRIRFVALLPFSLLPLLTRLALAAASAPAPAPPPTPSIGAYVPGEVLVAFREDVPDLTHVQIAAQVSAVIVKRQPVLGYVKLRLPEGASVEDAVRTLAADPRVAWAEPNRYYTVSICPSCPQDLYLRDGPGDADQWGVFKTGAYSLWRHGGGGSDTLKIAIVDTGIDSFANPHPDLAANVLPTGRDFVPLVPDADPTDEGTFRGYGHGTHVAGIAAAVANTIGIAGIAYCSKILVVRVLDCTAGDGCPGSVDDIADGIQYAADQGARVINLSLGDTVESNCIRTAVYYALGKQSIVVAASGNDGRPTVSYPARIPEVIAVGATDITDAVAGFSNWGAGLDVVAPGVNIWSTVPGPGYAGGPIWSGTSMAAPFVSGIVALVAARNPKITPLEAETYIKDHVKNLPGDRDGAGRVDFTQLEDWSDARVGYPAVSHKPYLWEWLGDDASAETAVADPDDADGRPNRGGTHDTDGADDGVFPLSLPRLPFLPPHIAPDPNQLDLKASVCRFDGRRYGAGGAQSLHLDSWFDWNSDGTFANNADEREVVDHQENPAGWGGNSKTITTTIAPPTEHIKGNPLVVRSRLAYGASAGAPDATPVATGEVEDDVMINFVEDFDVSRHTIEPGVYMSYSEAPTPPGLGSRWRIVSDPFWGFSHHGQGEWARSQHLVQFQHGDTLYTYTWPDSMSTPVMDWSEYTEAYLRFFCLHSGNAGGWCHVAVDTSGVSAWVFSLEGMWGTLTWDLSEFTGSRSVKISFVSEAVHPFYEQGSLFIDDVVIWAYDDERPKRVTDLAVSRAADPRELRLTWTAPDENVTAGTGANKLANVYGIRYATSAIVTAADWARATPFTPKDVLGGGIFPWPRPPGGAESVALRVPSAFQPYFVALRTEDEVVNASLISNSPGDTPTPVLGVSVLALGDTTATPADTVRVFFSMSNTGNAVDTYGLVPRGSRPWPLEVEPGAVSLPPGGGATVSVGVAVPATAAPGQVDSVTLVATSLSDPSVADADVALVTVVGAPPCAHLDDHDVGNVRTTVTDQGPIGFLMSEGGPGSGFVFPRVGGTNRLYIGGFMAGTDSTYMLNRDHSFDPDPEWEAVGCLEPGPSGPWAQSWTGIYDDSGHPAPRGLEVGQASFAWAAAPDDDYVILSYELHNAGSSAISGLWAGLFMDWDLDAPGGYDMNRGAVDPDRDIAYMWREGGGDGAYVGINVLGPASSSQLTFVHNPTYIYPLHYLSDADRFHFLSGDDPAYVVLSTPEASDWSTVAGTGPFALAPGDTGRVAFALVAGVSLADLLDNASTAHARWLQISGAPLAVELEPAPAKAARFHLAAPSPNPFATATRLAFDLPARSQVELEVYDVRGRFVARLAEGAFDPGRHAVSWDGADGLGRSMPSGVYYVRLRAGSETRTEKLVLAQ